MSEDHSHHCNTYLRIRRRRNAGTAQTIKLCGLLLDENDKKQQKRGRCCDADADADEETAAGFGMANLALKDDNNTTVHPSTKKRQKRSLAVWRRVSLTKEEEEIMMASSANNRKKKKREYRVIDAVLDDDDDDDDDDDTNSDRNDRNKKRRRLTLLDHQGNSSNVLAAPKHKPQQRRKQQAYKILDPCQRLVDDSLQKVFGGEISIIEHFRFCTSDARLASDSCCSQTTWLAWRNEEFGNLLHACALWNDAAMANELVSLLLRDSSSSSSSSLLEGLTEAVDAEGRTPYQVAELSGHVQVSQVLEAVGADTTNNYVFDVYCLDDDDDDEHEDAVDDGTSATNKSSSQDAAAAAAAAADPMAAEIACELEGAMGYWDNDGKLVLQQIPSGMADVDADDDEDDVDSNHEEWSGNDYPDDIEGDSDDDDNDDDLYDLPDDTFRGRPVSFASSSKSHYEPDDITGGEDFDASYGIYGQKEPEYDWET